MLTISSILYKKEAKPYIKNNGRLTTQEADSQIISYRSTNSNGILA